MAIVEVYFNSININIFDNEKTLGVLTVLLCATPMVYAQADGNAALKSSDVATALNGVAAKGKVIDSSSCGENVNYELYDDYTLRIFGKGAMYNYDYFFLMMVLACIPMCHGYHGHRK